MTGNRFPNPLTASKRTQRTNTAPQPCPTELRPDVCGRDPCFSRHLGKGFHSPSSGLGTKDSTLLEPLGPSPRVGLRSRTRAIHSKDLHQHLLCGRPHQGLLPFGVKRAVISTSHRDRKSWQMAESMQHSNLTLNRKLLSKGLPSLTYQVSPETIEAVGPQGPIRKPGPAEGITRRARMELNFQAFHFTMIKTLRGQEDSFTPVLKAKQEKKSSGRPRVHEGDVYSWTHAISSSLSRSQKYWHLGEELFPHSHARAKKAL